MEKQPINIEQVFDDALDYIDAKQELLKPKMVEKSAKTASQLFSCLAVTLFFFIAFLFLSIALAHAAGELLGGHEYAGYLIVTILYIIIGFLMIKYRQKWMENPFMDKIIRQLLSNNHND